MNLYNCELYSRYQGDTNPVYSKVVRAPDAGIANTYFLGWISGATGGVYPQGQTRVQGLKDEGKAGVLMPYGHIHTFPV